MYAPPSVRVRAPPEKYLALRYAGVSCVPDIFIVMDAFSDNILDNPSPNPPPRFKSAAIIGLGGVIFNVTGIYVGRTAASQKSWFQHPGTGWSEKLGTLGTHLTVHSDNYRCTRDYHYSDE